MLRYGGANGSKGRLQNARYLKGGREIDIIPFDKIINYMRITRSTIQHLRLPFSLFLMPIFLFAWAQVGAPHAYNAWAAFVVLHVFIYPASNGYNSYFDRDEGSIGGLEHPPSVTPDLYAVALLWDGIGIVLAATISPAFAVMVTVYGLVSKAYSHPWIRLKKYPIASWLTVGLFQGGFTYLMSVSALLGLGWQAWLAPQHLWPAALATVLLLASYPMTQVYQHEEDAARGDRTISRLCGIRGTFHLTGALFALALGGFYVYFTATAQLHRLGQLALFLGPVMGYFGYWYFRVVGDARCADFRHAMRFNALSALSLIAYFVYWWATR